MRRYRPRARPPWWPQQEPWPPVDSPWFRRRRRFVRRMMFVVAPVFVLVVFGIASVITFFTGDVTRQRFPFSVWPFVAFFFLILFVSVMRRVGTPLTDVVSAAQRVGDGDFSVRLKEVGPPFVRSIARALNTMIFRLKAQDDQRRQLMAEVAHELRT